MANRAIQYRLYPTTAQETSFAKTFGCCRKVYNLMLAHKIAYYKETGNMLHNTPAQYKKEYPFLREVDSLALANTQLHLERAYKNFFQKKYTGFPKFKSAKYSRKSYTTNNQNGTIAILDGEYIKLPKVGKVKLKLHRKPNADWVIKSATVSKKADGNYYVSVLFEYATEIKTVSKTTDKVLGLDYKSDGLYMDSNGYCPNTEKYYRKSQVKLRKLQRRLSRRVGSKKNETKSQNYLKQLQKVNKLHVHISNQRKDFLHKESTKIANLYDIVCVETLNMRAMSNKGFRNGKATMDNSYGMFLTMLEYKLTDRGKYFVKIDKWYASSQICSACGAKHPEMKITKLQPKKEYMECSCGLHLQRDYNAASNIKKEGLRLLREEVA